VCVDPWGGTSEDRQLSYLYPEARSAAAAVNSAQITIEAFCWQGAEIVAVERA
jgi:hypothetical protein